LTKQRTTLEAAVKLAQGNETDAMRRATDAETRIVDLEKAFAARQAELDSGLVDREARIKLADSTVQNLLIQRSAGEKRIQELEHPETRYRDSLAKAEEAEKRRESHESALTLILQHTESRKKELQDLENAAREKSQHISAIADKHTE